MVIRNSFFDNERKRDLKTFYELIAQLEHLLGGPYDMSTFRLNNHWPDLNRCGVYFFRDPSEPRSDTGEGARIVRVGMAGAQRSGMRDRLYNHKGHDSDNGGQHRASDFREGVGLALMERESYQCPTWGIGRARPKDSNKNREVELEEKVSNVIRRMSCVWVVIDDEDIRSDVERNAIALLSNYGKVPLDPPSLDWLGRHSDRERVKLSGLWNSNHVDDGYDPAFLNNMQRLIEQM